MAVQTTFNSAALDLDSFLGGRSLILGEVNTGKTTLTRKVLEHALSRIEAERVAVLDLAPEIPPHLAARIGLSGLGGRLYPPAGRPVLYLSARLDPPRLMSRSEEEALVVARRNLEVMEGLLTEYDHSGRDVLFINDASLYLQAGRAEVLWRRLAEATTVVANGYYGQWLGQGELSRRERREMETLMALFARVIRLDPPNLEVGTERRNHETRTDHSRIGLGRRRRHPG
ncbi:MAG: hypothetical protein AB1641_28120 [Thermodesulfobacteriota bacterium]